ncbi:hypothetical protein PcaKH15_04550 [Parageobacillus caldoxylosilyticus]|jgi:hypothetical protein|nr:hypothetical protein PcaKH15_04550 [Parageobacillus caldoxylosilyticus]BDG38321.1 hypothetical protein PcaKH16_04600 [Parageobacillus caldoxylosilyticus]BDG42111.1 hypothetical protein PcaKH35_04560 [Parageobacillus caldoxylosilyticus]
MKWKKQTTDNKGYKYTITFIDAKGKKINMTIFDDRLVRAQQQYTMKRSIKKCRQERTMDVRANQKRASRREQDALFVIPSKSKGLLVLLSG